MKKAHILVVDDEPEIRNLLQEILQDEGYSVDIAEDGQSAQTIRRKHRPDLVLLDIWMPDIDGISLLKQWSSEESLPCPVIMMSGHGTVETAVEATRHGAYDFIEKPLSLAKLLLIVENALESYHLLRENVGLRRHVIPSTEPVGHSTIMRDLRDQIKRIAQHDSCVLISGEAGSGKSLFARFLHQLSARHAGPFVDVGVATLLSENPALGLFGSEQGEKVEYGLLEQANGGILFLDDIGDLDSTLQARLFGALEHGKYVRVGGHQQVKVDVRVVAATRFNLEQRVEEGLFRNDLFYHLNVLPITLPALHDHNEDVPDLLEFYVNYFVSQERLPYRNITLAAKNRLRNYPWPGNVRELKNLIQRLLIVGDGEEIDVEEIEQALENQPLPLEHEQAPTGEPLSDVGLPLRQARERFERSYFEELLRKYGGSVVQVAKHAGMERTHLYRKLRSLDLNPKQLK